MIASASYNGVVVGGGVASAACAYWLARDGLRILVVHQSDTRPLLGESLPPAANRELAELGLLRRFQEEGRFPSYGTASAWGSDRLRDKDFINQSEGHGWHLDTERFTSLMQIAARNVGCLFLQGTLTSAKRTTGSWTLEISPNGERSQVHADILIDATGRKRHVATLLGMKSANYDRLIAAVCTFSASQSTVERRTYVESGEWGWWYANPIFGKGRVVGFLTDSDVMRRLRMSDPRNWCHHLALTIHIGQLVSRPTQSGSPITLVPAYSSRLYEPAGEGWFAVGDAAATYDPLSAFGFTAALIGSRMLSLAINSQKSSRDYVDWFNIQYASYLAHLVSAYDSERRWPTSVFWKRRHELAKLALNDHPANVLARA